MSSSEPSGGSPTRGGVSTGFDPHLVRGQPAGQSATGQSASGQSASGQSASGPSASGGWFRRFSHATADIVGRSQTFIIAVAIIAAWGCSGPFFHYSDTWQLVINTGTTIVTFLMVFLIQNTQNRDAQAIHLKLDELIRANTRARNNLVALEGRSDEELKSLQSEFEHVRDHIEGVREKRRGSRPPSST